MTPHAELLLRDLLRVAIDRQVSSEAIGIRVRNSIEAIERALAAPTVEGKWVPVSGWYVASRTYHAAVWRNHRASGIKINSSWIDEAGEGETADFGELWSRIVSEIKQSEALMLYIASVQDFPLKGALVEVGMALALGKPVFVEMRDVALEGRTMRPVGSWLMDRNVRRVESFGEAIRMLSAVSSAPQQAESRSILRRKAAQRGEPIPEFPASGKLLESMPPVLPGGPNAHIAFWGSCYS